MNYIFEAEDKNLEKLNAIVHSLIAEKCKLDLLNEIDLAVEEIFINICHYAYQGKKGVVEVNIRILGDVFEISFIDEGKPFNPLELADPDLSLSAEERRIGGLGIFLTKKYMDKVEYKFQDNKNILSFSKKFKMP